MQFNVTVILVMEFSEAGCYIVFVSKYSLEHPVLKHPYTVLPIG